MAKCHTNGCESVAVGEVRVFSRWYPYCRRCSDRLPHRGPLRPFDPGPAEALQCLAKIGRAVAHGFAWVDYRAHEVGAAWGDNDDEAHFVHREEEAMVHARRAQIIRERLAKLEQSREVRVGWDPYGEGGGL